jgi:hypothetical protein
MVKPVSKFSVIRHIALIQLFQHLPLVVNRRMFSFRMVSHRRAHSHLVDSASEKRNTFLWNRNNMNREVSEFFWYFMCKGIAFDFVSRNLGRPGVTSLREMVSVHDAHRKCCYASSVHRCHKAEWSASHYVLCDSESLVPVFIYCF